MVVVLVGFALIAIGAFFTVAYSTNEIRCLSNRQQLLRRIFCRSGKSKDNLDFYHRLRRHAIGSGLAYKPAECASNSAVAIELIPCFIYRR
jgi:hypothetical protein